MDFVGIHFWIIHIALILFFIGGLAYKFLVILNGSVSSYKDDDMNRWSRFWYYFRKFFKTVFSRRLGKIIKALITDGVFHKNLLIESPMKWITHALMFFGLLALFLLSVLSGIAVEIAPLAGYQAGTSEFLDALSNMDHWAVAVLNELLNVVVLIGLVLAFIRGFITKRKKGMFMFQDIFLLVFIGFILYTGWVTEALRYIIEQTPHYIARIGFLGYYLSKLFKLIAPNMELSTWGIWYKVFWHVHVSVIWATFIYIPFSKFSHVLFSPTASIINILDKKNDQESR